MAIKGTECKKLEGNKEEPNSIDIDSDDEAIEEEITDRLSDVHWDDGNFRLEGLQPAKRMEIMLMILVHFFISLTKSKRHVNTQHEKNFMSTQSFFAEKGLSEVETKNYIATLVCDDNSHKTIVCTHSPFTGEVKEGDFKNKLGNVKRGKV